jgi:DNA-binding MarR family transcriptional regulator
MVIVGRISKREREAPLQTVRKMLKSGKQTWANLREKTTCSPSTLSAILKDLVKTGEIRVYRDETDGRITWYEAIGKQITGQIWRYDAARFLENMKNPAFDGLNEDIDDFKISMSCYFEGLDESKEKEVIEATLSSFDLVGTVIAEASSQTKIEKVAIVVTAEKKKAPETEENIHDQSRN